MTTLADNFNRTGDLDGSTASGGGTWDVLDNSGDPTLWDTNGTILNSPGFVGFWTAWITTDLASDDHYAQSSVTWGSGSPATGVGVRIEGASGSEGYGFEVGPGNAWRLYRWDTDANIASGTGASSPDTIYLEFDGTSYDCQINGGSVASGTNSLFSGHLRCAISSYKSLAGETSTHDNFESGDLGGGVNVDSWHAISQQPVWPRRPTLEFTAKTLEPSTTEAPPALSWLQPASEPPRFAPPRQTAGMTFVAEQNDLAAAVTVDMWFQLPQQASPRRQPNRFEFAKQVEPSLAEAPPELSWFQPPSEPVRTAAPLRTASWLERPLEPSLFIKPDFNSWWRPASEPVRQIPRPTDIGLFTTSPEPIVEPFTFKWFVLPSEPVREVAPLQQQEWFIRPTEPSLTEEPPPLSWQQPPAETLRRKGDPDRLWPEEIGWFAFDPLPIPGEAPTPADVIFTTYSPTVVYTVSFQYQRLADPSFITTVPDVAARQNLKKPFIARDPEIPRRLGRFTDIVSDLLNSLLGGGYIQQVGIGSWKLIGGSLVYGRDPGVNDGQVIGANVGTLWVNTVSGKVFVCTDNTIAAAVWVPLN